MPTFTLPNGRVDTDGVNVAANTPVPVNDTVCEVAPVAAMVTVPVAAVPLVGVNLTITVNAVVVDVVVASCAEVIVFDVP